MALAVKEAVDDALAPQANYGNYSVDGHVLAFLVGVIAFSLPIILWLLGRTAVCQFDSISHFYYAPLGGDLFVIMLGFIFFFMVAYRGRNPIENYASGTAGLCALMVALVPTERRGCETGEFKLRLLADVQLTDVDTPLTDVTMGGIDPHFTLFEGAQTVHLGFALTLFLLLALHCLVIFPRVLKQHRVDGKLIASKWWRNAIYYTSGVTILAMIALMGLEKLFQWPWWDRANGMFYAEALALWAFGLSWMVKGRFLGWSFIIDPVDPVLSPGLSDTRAA
ncbi:MAG: hypothetical protein AAFO93_03870 [Pseudomonadota bacterium]